MKQLKLAAILTLISVGLAIFAAYSLFSRNVPTACPQYLEGGQPEWHEIYCGRAYLWVPRPPSTDATICEGGPLIRLKNCIKLDNPNSLIQQKIVGSPVQAGSGLGWPWNTGHNGLIVYDKYRRWQQVLEVAACGETFARWPRTCYDEFMGRAWRVVFGFSGVVFLFLFSVLVIFGGKGAVNG